MGAENARTTPSGASVIEFERVTKHYDAAALKAGAGGAVDDLSLVVPAGRIAVLVGPSGCGKTTTLKMVNRLIEPTSGRILIDGADISARDVTELRREIGYVIQQVGLFPHQTIAQNVATVPKLLGWSSDRQRRRSDELLDLVGLDPSRYGDRYPSQLSGGERQRVGVARALAADPPVMLMDEPFGAVDPIVRERLQNEFLRLQEDLAKTILFVTHDIDEAIKMGDLVVVMEDGGKIAQASAPTQLLAAPASDYVARFVGTDRGLKRLSLYRVDDVALETPVVGHPGEAAADLRAAAMTAESDFVLLLDDDDRPIGWVATNDLPSSGVVSASDADPMSPFLDRRTTLKDATSRLLDEEVRKGVVVDPDGRVLGLLTLQSVMQWLQDDRSREVPDDIAHAVTESVVSTVDGEAPEAADEAVEVPLDPVIEIRWAWIIDHLDDVGEKTWQHLQLLIIPMVIGFAIAFTLAIIATRRPGTVGPVTAVTGLLYTIPSLAAFALLIPITGLSLMTAIIPLTTYTLLILYVNTVAGFRSVPADVNEAADAMGYGTGARLFRIQLPLAIPLIMAGVRVAAVTTIGLVTVAAIIGGNRFGGLGQFITEGLQTNFDTKIYLGALGSVALAFVVDGLLVALQRLLTPWTRARAAH